MCLGQPLDDSFVLQSGEDDSKYVDPDAPVEKVTCGQCGEEFVEGDEPIVGEYYLGGAFSDEPTEYHFCSEEECRDSYEQDGMFCCDGCYRYIVESLGHNLHYRLVNDCEILCLRCYEEDILRDGVPRETFEEGKLAGMFFARGNPEPLEAGWKEVPRYGNYLISAYPGALENYCKYALRLIDHGWMVLTGYERLSIIGDDGWVTMFAKKKPKPVSTEDLLRSTFPLSQKGV